MTDLPNDIKTTLNQLCQNQQFISNLSYYTKVAFQSLYSISPNQQQQGQLQCPTPFLFAIAHYISNGIPLQNLHVEFPQSVRQQYVKAVRLLQKKLYNSTFQQNNGSLSMKILNDSLPHLLDVKWEMMIQSGREVWIVQLITTDSQKPTVLKLNYEELSLFTFKINQIFGHIKSLDLQKLV